MGLLHGVGGGELEEVQGLHGERPAGPGRGKEHVHGLEGLDPGGVLHVLPLAAQAEAADVVRQGKGVFREQEAGERQDHADGRQQGDALVKDQGGGQHREDRREVDVGRGLDRPDGAQGVVPGRVAHAGGQQAQKEDVSDRCRIHEVRHLEGPLLQGQEEQQGGQAPEQDAPRGFEHGVAAVEDEAREQGVDGPGEGGQHGEEVAEGVEAKGARPVEGDERDAGNGDDEAKEEGLPEALFERGVADQSREEGRRAEDDAGVGGVGVEECRVLEQKVDRDAKEPCAGKEQLRPPAAPVPEEVRAQAEEKGCRRGEAEDDDLERRVGFEQDLRGNEGQAPDGRGAEGEEVG